MGHSNPYPEHEPAGAPHATLGLRAVRTADVALTALARITALLDDDCDETGCALYNARSTVASIRGVLTQAATELDNADRSERPTLRPEAPL